MSSGPTDGTPVPGTPEVVDLLYQHAVALIAATRQRPASRIVLRAGDVSVDVSWPEGDAAHVLAVAAGPGGEPDDPGPDAAQRHHVGAPMVGTFYLAPGPGQPPFVAEGDVLRPGQQIGIIEAMKMMNPVEADQAGRVAGILVADGTSVEYGEWLVAIDTAGFAA